MTNTVLPVDRRWMRPLAVFGVLSGLALFGGALWICTEMLLPIAPRLFRQAPIVEVVYPALWVPSGLALGPLVMLGSIHVLLYGTLWTTSAPVGGKQA